MKELVDPGDVKVTRTQRGGAPYERTVHVDAGGIAEITVPAPEEADVAVEARKNRVESWSSSVSGMPMPVSRTVMVARWSWTTSESVTRPPAGENFTAFESRLSTACPSLVASPRTTVLADSSITTRICTEAAAATGSKVWPGSWAPTQRATTCGRAWRPSMWIGLSKGWTKTSGF